MSKRKSKGGSKKGKSKKSRERDNKSNSLEQKENLQKAEYEEFMTVAQDSVAEDVDDIQVGSNTSKTPSDANPETNTPTDTNINDCYEEIKAKQEELLNNIRNLSEILVAMTLTRDNINSLNVDNLTELYFTRQVRPLLDALNIISFAVNNMTTGAVNIQTNTFGDRKEIRHALSLSYKMNDEVSDIITVLGRRLKIFLKQIDCMDKNCPPFDSGKDS